MRIAALFVVLLAAAPAWAQIAPASCPAPLATIAKDGSVLSGSKTAVLSAASRGAALRVGWELDPNNDEVVDLRHWADAGFVSEFRGEVFSQIDDIQQQAPGGTPPRVRLPAGRHRWTGLIGTTGLLESHFDDGTEPTSVRVKTLWCLASCPAPAWRLVFHHENDGRPIAGDRTALLDAVRRGLDVRLAWGAAVTVDGREASVEHAADPVFISVMNGGELFVQLPEHIAQTSYADPSTARFGTPSVLWRGLLGTTGTFDAVMVDRATGQEVRRLPQKARIAWFVRSTGEPACDGAAVTLAVPQGVIRAPGQ